MAGARVALLYVNSDPSSTYHQGDVYITMHHNMPLTVSANVSPGGPALLVAHAWPLGTPDPAHAAAVVVDLHYPHDANCGHLVAQAQNELTTASSLINQVRDLPSAACI